MSATTPVYELRGVSKRHSLGATVVHALEDVDLVVQPGDSLAITGPSGSGKSTLLSLLGLLDRPTSGDLLFLGADPARLPDREISRLRGRRIGFVFQAFRLLPDETALGNVMLPLIYAGVPDAGQRALAALERVGLAARSGHRPEELSGGERQRVAVARALVKDPAVILADEPTGNLDSVSGGVVLDLLSDLAGSGATLVVVTHEEEVAARCARRIDLRDGRICR